MRLGLIGAAAATAATFATLVAADARAQTATQLVQFQVNAVSQIGVSGSPAPLLINSAIPGDGPTSVSVEGTSYGVTTNQSNQKITASLDQPMPAGLTLEVSLAAPTGASSAGDVVLGTSGADVVTGISATASSALPIRYRLSATPIAAVTGPQARTVTFTIVAGQ